jgi:hypothetical protein
VAWSAVQRKGKATNAASISIGAGDGWATPTSGNLLVVTANSDATVSITGTWTAGPSVIDGNGTYIWYRISDGTESTITCSPSVSDKICITACEYSGNAASPFDVSNSSTISGSLGTTTTSVSVTTTADADLVIATAMLHGYGNVPVSPSWTNSFVNALSTDTGGATGTDACTFYAELLPAGTAGSYSTSCSWTNSASNRQELVIAFKAATTTAVYPPYRQGRRRFVPPRYIRPLPRAAMPVPAQLNPPYPPAGVKHPQRVRALLPRSGGAAKPVPPQLLPPYPPAGVMRPGRLRNLLARRGRSAQVMPAQVVSTAPAFIPQAVHSRVKAYAARRRLTQFMPPDQPGVIQTARVRLRLPRLTRGHTAQPAPAQVVVPPAAFVPNRARQATVRAATARRAHVVVPPVPQAPAPLFTRIKLRAARIFRGKPRPVVPPQVVIVPPAYPTQPVRVRKKPWPRRRAVAQPPVPTAHSCTTARPSTGITARPSSGTTAYNTATTARPNTGTTARPNTGTTSDPC